MTSATPESGSGASQTMVQLTNLPDLTEVSHLEIDAPVLEILKKSVLFQLNSLNICISNFALDEMVNLVGRPNGRDVSELTQFGTVTKKVTSFAGGFETIV